MRGFLGDTPHGGFQITSGSTLLLPGDDRQRSSTGSSRTLPELVEARIWADLHLRATNVKGERLGRNVVAYRVANHYQRGRPGR